MMCTAWRALRFLFSVFGRRCFRLSAGDSYEFDVMAPRKYIARCTITHPLLTTLALFRLQNKIDMVFGDAVNVFEDEGEVWRKNTCYNIVYLQMSFGSAMTIQFGWTEILLLVPRTESTSFRWRKKNRCEREITFFYFGQVQYVRELERWKKNSFWSRFQQEMKWRNSKNGTLLQNLSSWFTFEIFFFKIKWSAKISFEMDVCYLTVILIERNMQSELRLWVWAQRRDHNQSEESSCIANRPMDGAAIALAAKNSVLCHTVNCQRWHLCVVRQIVAETKKKVDSSTYDDTNIWYGNPVIIVSDESNFAYGATKIKSIGSSWRWAKSQQQFQTFRNSKANRGTRPISSHTRTHGQFTT